MIYIYDDKGNFIESLNYEKEEFEKEWYTEWKNGYIISEIKFDNPIVDKEEIREKTREELILLDNRFELLQVGEYVEAGEIIVVKAPDNLIKKVWDKEAHIWKEGTTREELIELRKNKIVEYEKLENEKKLLEGSKFSSEDEMKVIVEKMAVIEGNINSLEDKIKLL